MIWYKVLAYVLILVPFVIFILIEVAQSLRTIIASVHFYQVIQEIEILHALRIHFANEWALIALNLDFFLFILSLVVEVVAIELQSWVFHFWEHRVIFKIVVDLLYIWIF